VGVKGANTKPILHNFHGFRTVDGNQSPLHNKYANDNEDT
jgi:hypothetical protein